MNKFAKALLLALIFAAPVTAFASQAQARTIHHSRVKAAKVHHKTHYKTHYKRHAKNLAPKTHS
ncbi:hypothetical protein [Nostoc sp. NMS4]|uniref:hypothetical protein n=1 Tax=Nostoc sp. NMS4 TaxID=2815390 RepID=UPI0025CDE80B|nr:hypothetical protein [Nostoc sp. NMS4]MBN3926668.1 hypothetical protein [Nostoc sp. NMS4]